MTQQTTITIRNGQAFTNMPSPRVGARLTPDQSAALHAMTLLTSEGLQPQYGNEPLTKLAGDLLNPEQWGHTAGAEIRAAARRALGITLTETEGKAA